MSDILDDNKINADGENDDGMLIIFPDENTDDEVVEEENDGESFSLSFGKVNAARKEEDFNFLPFLNIPEVVDEEDEDSTADEDDADDGENFSLSFGKVSAAKKERDYVYMPFLNVDESAPEEEAEPEKEPEEEDSGIDIVGGDELFDLTPLKTRDSASGAKAKSGEKSAQKNAPSAKKPAQQKKGKAPAGQQKKKQPQKNAMPQKPNKVQQIMAQMDPDIIASVSADPRQMLMLEETIRSELIKQAAHNAVARELSADLTELPEIPRKRPPQQSKPKNAGNQQKSNLSGGLNFSKQQLPKKKNTPVSIVDTSTISEFGSEAVTPTTSPTTAPTATTSTPAASANTVPVVQQMPNAVPTPIVTQPVIIQPPIQPQPVQQPSTAAQPTQRKQYTPTSPAAIRAAMKAGSLSFDTPATAQASDSSSDTASGSAQSAQSRKRIEIQKQLGEKRSGCVIGAIALLMVVFVAIIALISGGDIMTQCGYSESFSKAQTFVDRGDYESAIEVLEGIKDYSQTAALLNECYYELGQRAENGGDYETAISYYNKTVDYDKAIRCRIDLQKLQADEYSAAAEETNESELYMKAYSLYVSILSDFETYPELTDATESKEIQNKSDAAKFDYAKVLFEEENYSEAKSHFESLMSTSYAEADAWYYNTCYNLGRVYFENGNYISAKEELQYFENSRHGLEDSDYANAVAFLGLSRLYGLEGDSADDVVTMQDLFSLLTKAYEDADGDVKAELESAMSSPEFTKIKLLGFWKNDTENYIVFENGEMSFYLANEAVNGLSEIYSDDIRFADGDVILNVDGTEYVVMKNVTFESTYQMSPQTLIFVNPYDGYTYKMYRFR